MPGPARRWLIAAGLTCAAIAGSAAPASASPLDDCPREQPSVRICFGSTTTGGAVQIRSLGISISRPLVISGGLTGVPLDPGAMSPIVGAKLTGDPLNVPGGLIGIPGTEYVPAIVRIPIIGPIIRQIPIVNQLPGVQTGLTQVTAQTQLAGTPRIGLVGLLAGRAAIELPVKFKLANGLLGDNCYIGSDANPIVLRLGIGRTSPPAPNRPITGSLGRIGVTSTSVRLSGSKLVDNSFGVPSANGCTPLGISLLEQTVSGVVNAKQGLPSGPGHNTAILQANSELAANGGRLDLRTLSRLR